MQCLGLGFCGGVGGGGWVHTPIYKGQGCLSYLVGVKNMVLAPPGASSLKRCTVRAFVVPFRVLNWKNMGGDNVLF